MAKKAKGSYKRHHVHVTVTVPVVLHIEICKHHQKWQSQFLVTLSYPQQVIFGVNLIENYISENLSVGVRVLLLDGTVSSTMFHNFVQIDLSQKHNAIHQFHKGKHVNNWTK